MMSESICSVSRLDESGKPDSRYVPSCSYGVPLYEGPTRIALTDYLPFRHWTRSCVLQCCPEPDIIDKIIPIYIDSQLDEDPMECLSSLMIASRLARTPDPQALFLVDSGHS